MKKEVILIGYSGHGWVACDIFSSMGWKVIGYCEKKEKLNNPYKLKYFGDESDAKSLLLLRNRFVFPAIGDNTARERVFKFLLEQKLTIVNAVHAATIVSPNTRIGAGVMLGAGVILNSGASIGDGVICNTASVIEHECSVGRFAHIGPGSVLCGNVEVGERTLVGANSVVRPEIRIGRDVIIGSGAPVVKDIGNNKIVAGTSLREL